MSVKRLKSLTVLKLKQNKQGKVKCHIVKEMVLWSYCTNTNAISEVNTNYTIFLSNNNSFLDPAGSSNNGLKNPQTEDKQWLYKSRLNPVVHGNVKTEQFHLVHRSQTCHAIQACKTNSNSKKKTKKKKKMYLGISRMTESGIIKWLLCSTYKFRQQ